MGSSPVNLLLDRIRRISRLGVCVNTLVPTFPIWKWLLLILKSLNLVPFPSKRVFGITSLLELKVLLFLFPSSLTSPPCNLTASNLKTSKLGFVNLTGRGPCNPPFGLNPVPVEKFVELLMYICVRLRQLPSL